MSLVSSTNSELTGDSIYRRRNMATGDVCLLKTAVVRVPKFFTQVRQVDKAKPTIL